MPSSESSTRRAAPQRLPAGSDSSTSTSTSTAASGCVRVRLGSRIDRRNVADHGDRAVEFDFRTDDAEVSRASDGSAVVLLEAAHRLPGGPTPAPPGYPTASDRATFRPREVSSRGIGAARRPAIHACPRASEAASDLRPEPVTEASRLCRARCRANAALRIDRPRKIVLVLVLSEAVLVLVLVLVLAGSDKGDDMPSFESSTRRAAPQHLPADQIRVRVPPQAAAYEYDWDRASTGGTSKITRPGVEVTERSEPTALFRLAFIRLFCPSRNDVSHLR